MLCIFMIVIVLLQQGKGADAGVTFGGGSSQALFGSGGPLPLLNKVTTMTAVVLMVTSLSLAYLATDRTVASVMKEIPVSTDATLPPPLPLSDDN